MPPQALANGNWGGRELPEYQNLSMAMRTMLSLAKLCARLVDITLKNVSFLGSFDSEVS